MTQPIHKILFICHGNICRSPMAEFVMKQLVKDEGLEGRFEIASAATSPEEIGNPVYPPARSKLAEHGICCEGKTARQITRQDYTPLMQIAMDYVNQHYPTDNVLIMGDFNMYSANESGYRLLTQTYSNPNICFKDPIGGTGVGEWSNNSQFAAFHTQSTRSYSEECFAGGGLDDRFDFILMADEIAFSYNHLRYVQGSYHAVGNDGRHFNQSIDQNGNHSVPQEVVEALFDGSDHLPVTMKIAVNAHLGVDEMTAHGIRASVAPNPAADYAKLSFYSPSQGQVQFELYSMQGQLLQRESDEFGEGEQRFEIPLFDLVKGIYLLRILHSEGWAQTLKIVKS